MKYTKVVLKKGKEKAIRNRHPWVFSGAIEKVEESDDSPVARVVDWKGEFLGWGVYNPFSSLVVRVLSFEEEEEISSEFFRKMIEKALSRRRPVKEYSNSYRVVNSEGDGLSGLIVDRYDEYVVVQIRSRGLEFFKDLIVDLIQEILEPVGIYERNDFESRSLEKLPRVRGVLRGEVPEWVIVREHDWQYRVNLYRGQKTGFFLDQRDNRKLLYDFVEEGMSVANTFAYTGGFSIPAEKKGASAVNVEISGDSLRIAEENYILNGLHPLPSKFLKADVFDWLREEKKRGSRYDVVVLDPPAFAKTLNSVKKATRGYKDINMYAARIVREGGYLFTFSCSNHIDISLFQKVVFSAFKDAGREGFILKRMGQPPDHPISIYHPEGEYLKGLLIQVF